MTGRRDVGSGVVMAILVRYYFHKNSSQRVGHVVMLAPPIQGSEAVDAMRNLPGFKWINGPAGS